jgi:hypothetical protein
MKTILILIITIVSLSPKIYGQTADSSSNCSKFKTGVFKLDDFSVYTIQRSAHKQIENDIKTGSITALDIKWLTDCTYILFNPRVIKGVDDIPEEFKTDTMYNEIRNINENSFEVVTTTKKHSFESKTTIVKVDDSLLYRNMTKLPKFKDYNGNAWGGTVLDDNYAIAYSQSTNNKKRFAFVFEEVYSIDNKGMFRLLDNIFFDKEDNQSIATSNCRYNEKYDPEIMVVYSSKNDSKESKIIKAWRCNRKTLKIEIVDSKNVKYKVEDKNRHQWDK